MFRNERLTFSICCSISSVSVMGGDGDALEVILYNDCVECELLIECCLGWIELTEIENEFVCRSGY